MTGTAQRRASTPPHEPQFGPPDLGREPRSAIRCRAITDQDLNAVVRLLTKGFPGRSQSYWRLGLDRYRSTRPQSGELEIGFVLLSGDEIVGVLLTFHSVREAEGRRTKVCNLSSWYVEPAFRTYATLLEQFATREKDVVYINISAVRRTWPMQEARGFRRYSRGAFVTAPLLSRPRRNTTVQLFADSAASNRLPEAEQRLLADHSRFGCICLVAEGEHGPTPFVFIWRPAETIRQRFGWSPLGYLQLIYCRSTASLAEFAHALGRHLLLRHAAPLIVVDATGPLLGLKGLHIERWGAKFSRGPTSLPLGDLAYTELVLLGP